MSNNGLRSGKDLPFSGIERSRIIAMLLGVLAIIAVGFVLKQAQAVVLPLIIAWLLSYILAPVVNFLQKRRVPTGLAVGVVLFLLLGTCYLAAVFLHARVSAFVEAYPRYQTRFNDLLETVRVRFDLTPESVAGIDWDQQIRQVLLTVSGPLVSFTSSLLMVMVFLVFFLLGKPYFKYKIAKAFKREDASHLARIMQSISSQIGRYLYVQLLVSFATGFLVWLALYLIGVDFAVTWGALAFFLNFIPTLGSVVASIPPILLALLQNYPNFWPVVLTAVCVTAIQVTIGNFVAPKMMGDRLNLSPVAVLLSLVFWGWLWGIVGALLSVPIASAIKIVCENVEPLQPISVLMGSGRVYQQELERDNSAESVEEA